MSSLISKLYVVSSLCFAMIAFSVRNQLAWLLADAAAVGDSVGFPAFQIKQTPCSV